MSYEVTDCYHELASRTWLLCSCGGEMEYRPFGYMTTPEGLHLHRCRNCGEAAETKQIYPIWSGADKEGE